MEYLSQHNSQTGQYLNESERNVHVWCSQVKLSRNSRSQYKNSATLGLIGGCFIHDEWLPISVFYHWLTEIIEPSETKFNLFHLDHDPRRRQLFPGSYPMQNMVLVHKQNPAHMVPGHYMIYACTLSNNQYVSYWPKLRRWNFAGRTRTISQSPSPGSKKESRDVATRISVRSRDRRCVVTQQAGFFRPRGDNFTGLEVAHIFPLMGVRNDEWLGCLSEVGQTLVQTRDRADSPANAILLRADIHSLFDDYQWSVWPIAANTYKIIRFEKSGAQVLNGFHTINVQRQTLSTIANPDPELWIGHLRVALLTHVRGFGKPESKMRSAFGL